MIVDEINDLPVVGRKVGQAPSKNLGPILLLDGRLRAICRILDCTYRLTVRLIVRTSPEFRERLEPCDRQKPGRGRGVPLECTGLTPNFEKRLADHIVSKRLISNQPQNEPVDAHMVTREQN